MKSRPFRARVQAISRIGIAVIVAVVVIVAGVGGYLALSRPTISQHCGQDGQPLLIGMTLSQSGTFASLDGNYTKFNSAWVNYTNNLGGLTDYTGTKHNVSIKWYDDLSQHDLAVTQYHKLAESDRVCIMISPYSADIGKDLIPIAEADSVPIIMAEASTAGMWIPSNPHDWAVTSMVPYWQANTTTGWSGQYFQMLNQTQSHWAKNITLVGWDITWAKDDYNSSLYLAPKVGLNVLSHVLLTPDFTNPTAAFSAQITALKAQNPDIVYLATFGPVAALWIKAAVAQGWHPREWHTIEWGAAFFPILTSVPVGNVTTELFWTPTFATQGGSSYVSNGVFQTLLTNAGVTFANYQNIELRMIIFQMIQTAYQQAASLTPGAINTALHSLSINTISGHLTVQSQGYGTIGLVPVQYQNGRIQTVYPSSLANHSYVHP